MDYTTVYRTVTLLKNIGLIRQIDFHHNHAHFELALLGDHHHVVCKKCHTIVDVPHCNVRRMEKEALEDALRAARGYVPETTRRVCARCNGSGQLWQAGGASQTRVSAPSGSSASQREDFYNSAASLRTSYSSGSMGPCPVCGGSGLY
jgi:hypothetical protein